MTEPKSRMAQTVVVKEAAAKILALRRLTKETGFRTTRSQNDILALLNPDELAAVAEIITKQPEADRG